MRRRIAGWLLAALLPELAMIATAGTHAEIPTLDFTLWVLPNPPKSAGAPMMPPQTWMLREAAQKGQPGPHFSSHLPTPPCTLSAKSPRVRIALKTNWCCDSVMIVFRANQGPELFRRSIRLAADSSFSRTLTLVDSSGRKPIPGMYVLGVRHSQRPLGDARAIVISEAN